MTNLGGVAASAAPLLDIRPSRERIRAVRRGTAPLVAVAAAGAVVRGVVFGSHAHDAALWTVLLVLAGGGLLAAAALVSWRLRTLRIVVTETACGQTTMLGALRLWPRASLARVVSVVVRYSGASVPSPQWLFLDAEGNGLMLLNPRVWQPGDLEALTTMLGVTVEELAARPVKVVELRRQLPRVVPWWQAHTVLLGGLAAVVLIAALVPFAR